MKRLFPVVLLLGSVFATVPAQAQQDALFSAFKRCNDAALASDARIAACQMAAQAKGISNNERAFATSNLALIYQTKGDYPAALQTLNKAIDLEPSSWQMYANRIGIYGRIGELDLAYADYRKLTELDSSQVKMTVGDVAKYHTQETGEDAHDNGGEAAERDTALTQARGSLATAFAARCEKREQDDPASETALHDC